MSNGWLSYANTDTIQQGIYMHSVIIHQQNFIDRQDPDSHTQTVENVYESHQETKAAVWHIQELFPSYLQLHEFMYKRTNDFLTATVMLMTDARETCTRNSCELTCARNLYVCHTDSQQDFSRASF